MTWKPDEKMTEKQIEKELNRQAVLFEEADSLCHGNWIEIQHLRDRIRILEPLLTEAVIDFPVI